MRRNITILCLSLVGLASTACQPRYDGLEIRTVSGGDAYDAGVLNVTEGRALVIEIEPISSNPHEDYENFDLVTLESFDESVMLVSPSTDVDRFVLIGVGVGATAIDVKINDRDVDTIDARVDPQSGGGQ